MLWRRLKKLIKKTKARNLCQGMLTLFLKGDQYGRPPRTNWLWLGCFEIEKKIPSLPWFGWFLTTRDEEVSSPFRIKVSVPYLGRQLFIHPHRVLQPPNKSNLVQPVWREALVIQSRRTRHDREPGRVRRFDDRVQVPNEVLVLEELVVVAVVVDVESRQLSFARNTWKCKFAI